MRGEQNRARPGASEHRSAHAPDEEHGAGGRAQRAHARRLLCGDRAAFGEVGDDAAAHGVTR